MASHNYAVAGPAVTGSASAEKGVGINAGVADKLASAYLLLACLAFLVPCVSSLLEGSWTTEAGALGPLVLAAGLATLWSRFRESRADSQPGNAGLSLALLVPAVLVYLAASAITMSAALCAAGWLAMVAVLYAAHGPRVVRACWFPLLFLLIVIPLPYALTVEATAILRNLLAGGATSLAAWLGLQVAVDGYAVYVDQYELSIESACAGLSSTISLLAVGLLYAYWVREAGWRRIALIAVSAFPVAVAANLVRIVILLAAVHFGGAKVLATPLHPLSGFLSFTLALAMLLAIDRFAFALWRVGRAT